MKLLVSLVAVSLVLCSCSSEVEKQSLSLKGPGGDVPLFGVAKAHIRSSDGGTLHLLRNGKQVASRNFAPGRSAPYFPQPSKPGAYRLRAESSGLVRLSKKWRVQYPSLGEGSRSRAVKLFHSLIRPLGYGNAPEGKTWSEVSSLVALAYRKANGLEFKERVSPKMFRKLLRGEGRYELREKRKGKYVEVNLALQIMALAKDGKVIYTYHISSGAPATPSDLGKYRFYSKSPGFNSLGMYYTVYYNRGEGTHGFSSVPSYAASHGCIRNPIPSSVQIYNWIPIGAPIWVY